jgi:hypothetical protein
LRKGESPVLPGEERKEEEDEEEGNSGTQVESTGRELFFFQVPLKPIFSHGSAGPGGSHPK